MSQKKKGFYLDDEDTETSGYLNGPTQPSLYRERDMFNAGSPSQGLGSQMYTQQLSRNYNGTAPSMFQRSTPTSMLQPQSPSRGVLGSLSQNRGFHAMGQPYHGSLQQQKRLGTSSVYGGFGPQQTYGFQSQQQQARSSALSSGVDLQQQTGSMNNIDLSASEFPSLTSRNVPQPSSMSAIRNYVGMVGGSTKSIEAGGEFSMQQEDFPALPGSAPTTNGPDASGKLQSSDTSVSASSGKDVQKSDGASKGVKTLPDGTLANIPNGMVTDQFGMVGLLTFLRAAESDPNLVALAPGVDLTSLGLNLNSQESLYSTFQSPWADGPCRPQDIDYHVPSEYLTNVFIREKLSPIKLSKYGEDLLFYLFYTNPGDMLQVAASTELYNRDWRYHKDDRLWITRAPGMEPTVKSNSYERGHYYVFDPITWRKVLKEFHLEYNKLEDRPTPLTGSTSQQQPPSAASNSALTSH